ncbi:two-component system response regulator [Neiella marina]|uniref:Two-component system response regulator n=1 Tax=Neiella holothuriorum TaxID=2870530 RepID=A0ABS7EFQ3_9GAMM|nr:two-component system response regulator [Neiella holothuriorum]MBW8191085.1 two-component system response regulator [Neiella holothuriorum]
MAAAAKQTVLVVDDTPENLDVIAGILKENYKIRVATNGAKALKLADSASQPDIILLDIMMPEMDGYEVCQALKKNPRTARIPVIFVTAKGEVSDEAKGFELGAVDYITKPVSPPLVLARVKTQLALYDQERYLDALVAERTKALEGTRLQIIRRLGRAAEFKDNETGMHVVRMSHYSRIIAESMGMPEDYCDLILQSAPMHDIGKIGIPDNVMLKPGRLTDEEWVIMRTHPSIGAMIIGDHDSELLKMAKVIALNHHEKWDGSGYPNGVAGTDIPIEARIVAIADVFDALTTARPYKDAWPVEKAVDVIKQDAGSHFDPELVDVFVRELPKVLEIKEKYAETTESIDQQEQRIVITENLP